MSACLLLQLVPSTAQQPSSGSAQKDSFYLLSPVEVRAVRAGENAPFAKTNISKKEIEKQNLGYDIPFLLNGTPSVVVSSDAGNGVGYTGIRIRGTDATRINVTLNGIPYNDAESQGTFFVDLPDFSSSAGSIQVQRGVGTSSNGAGAFGASINFSTNDINPDAYAEVNNSYGSFGTWKNTVKAGSGLVNGFTSEARLSRVVSDGFIDRASSDLRSFYVTSAYTNSKTSLRVNVFSGKERTYQAWYGISEADLRNGDRTRNYAGTEKPGTPYEGETDNYTQTHYQLFFNQTLNRQLQFSTAVFLTTGKGYYEQYKAGQEYAAYGMPDPPSTGAPITTSDMIRRLWLDNDFYGNIFSLQYKKDNTQATLGGGYTRYDGLHFGQLTWAANGLTSLRNWYDLDARKTDFNLYLKEQTRFKGGMQLFFDLQYRRVFYDMEGFRNNPTLEVSNTFHFLNPKLGVSYRHQNQRYFLSYSVANKEPNRDDFEAGRLQQPRPERLHDIELGAEGTGKGYSWGATLYYMRYKDQLVLTGKINDVGAYTRTNIPRSYRAGIELQGAASLCKWANLSANISLSRNRVSDFTEYLDDYDNGGQKTNSFSQTTIAYSPSVVGSAAANFTPLKNTEFSLLSKYVGKQYLDNTEDNARSLSAFFVQDFRAMYTFKRKTKRSFALKEVVLTGLVNNLWDQNYEPNGYTYSYIAGGSVVTSNFYFPMAGRNFMLGVNLRF